MSRNCDITSKQNIKEQKYISFHPEAGAPDSRLATGFIAVNTDDLNRIAKCALKFNWAGIVWKDGHRQQVNFICSDWCVLDFDDSDLTLERALEVFSGHMHLIGTTTHHGIWKGNKPPRDRFRVVLQWDRQITDVRDYKYNLTRIQKSYGADPQATGAHMKWRPCIEIISIKHEGRKVSWVKAPAPTKPKPGKFDGSREIPPDLLRVLRVGIANKDGRHNEAFALAARLANYGFTESESLSLITASPLMDSVDEDHNRDIVRTVRDGWKKAKSNVG
jgi:hypothetical protein